MELKIVEFETTKILKEKGFDELCNNCFDDHGHTYLNGWCERIDNHFEDDFCNSQMEALYLNYFTAPTLALVQMWIREKHSIHVLLNLSTYDGCYEFEICRDGFTPMNSKELNLNYDKALEAGILEAVKLIK